MQHIWDASGRELNPRYLRPAWEFKDKHGLQVWSEAETLEMTKQGWRFLKEPDGRVVADIDSTKVYLPFCSC